MKIGVYGGTFDPPHLGHLQACEGAAALLGLDKLVLVPAKLPPHKDLPADSATPQHRLAMLQFMADAVKNAPAEVLDLELTRAGKSYTADTLLALREQYPGDELVLLMGSDMFLTLQCWHKPSTICSCASLCGFSRSEGEAKDCLEVQAQFLHECYATNVTTIALPNLVDVSSTKLRALLRGQRAAAARFLPTQVYGYILREKLYGCAADLTQLSDDDLRAASLSMVRAKRIAHICGTEHSAVELAKRWGADETKARRAAMMHDCTKYFTLEEQLALCARYNIALDDLERSAVKLLHAKTGAALARAIFGASDEICEAIFYHTTGKADMTLLSKILYVADYIEPSRTSFEGLEPMRRLAYSDIDAALLFGCELTIEDMQQRGVPVHGNTLAARDFLKGR